MEEVLVWREVGRPLAGRGRAVVAVAEDKEVGGKGKESGRLVVSIPCWRSCGREGSAGARERWIVEDVSFICRWRSGYLEGMGKDKSWVSSI